MPLLIPLPTLAATEALAARIAGLLRPRDAILLDGPLGTGKSALARALLRTLCDDPALDVPSPSYTLLQTYESPLGPVHHYDLWRLDGPAGVEELGWDDALDGIVLVEWPGRLGTLRPDEALTIDLTLADGDARSATLDGWPDRLTQLA